MILEKIKSPKDLKKVNKKDLPQLALEVKERILDVVSKNGGHLASNLGVIDLTIALHYVYDSPKDKIVWDVGHQCYAHKLLTGRQKEFENIRKEGGIPGFTNRFESEHDPFGAGHASTSISAALGMACSEDIKGSDGKAVAIIGDGALTGGMALEGLNNAGYLQKDILVILNDNRMSISDNVGALSETTKRIKNTKAYKEVKNDYHQIEKMCPASKKKYLENLKKHLYSLFTPEVVFTKLGFDYTGPIDGHNILKLIKTLETLKKKKGPKMLHIITKKGKGYKHAEDDSKSFHGVSCFNLRTGKGSKKKCELKTYSDSVGDILVKLGEKDKRIVTISAAMAKGCGLEPFQNKFPDRFFDVGIAEQHAVTFAAGLASQGMIPYVALYSTFLQRAYDQVLHDIALQKLPVIIGVDRAGICGADGATHNGQFDISFLASIPNLIICAPKDENEVQDLIYSAIKYKLPVAIRYPRGYGPGVCIEEKKNFIPIGKSEILKKGKDIVIIGYGSTVDLAMCAATELEDYGIKATVINARFAKPIDENMIKYAKKIGKVVVVEENTFIGGLGSMIRQKLNNSGTYFANVALPDKFVEHGDAKVMRDKNGVSIKNIVKACKKLYKK